MILLLLLHNIYIYVTGNTRMPNFLINIFQLIGTFSEKEKNFLP